MSEAAEPLDADESGGPPDEDAAGASPDGQGDAVREKADEPADPMKDIKAEEKLREQRERGLPGYAVGSVRINAERAAGRDFNEWHIHAAAQATAGAGAVAPEELDALRSVYVAGDTGDALWKRLAARRLVVLHGERDSGRRATALVALDEVTGCDRASSRVAILPPPKSLADLAKEDLKKGRGHLVDMSGRREPVRDQEATIGRLREWLADAKAYLVVLSDDRASARALLGETYEHRPPNPDDILLAHLTTFMPGLGRAGVARLIAEAERDPQVGSWLKVMRTPEVAVELAEVIGDWAGDRESDPEAAPDARARRYAYLKRQAQPLLLDIERDHAPLHQAFALAAGVLNGRPLAEITEAAEDLTRRLREIEQPGAEATGRPVFGDPLPGRLTYADVGDKGRGRVVELHDPALAGVLLDVVWDEYDAAHRCVLDWLMWLCGSDRQGWQARGALAIARIAAIDFRLIRWEVLEPWSKQGRRRLLQCAAWILEALYVSGDERVWPLVRNWARAGRWQQRLIAVRALGTRIGKDRPAQALRDIADAGEKSVKSVRTYARYVDNALVELYDLGAREQVLGALYDWRGRPVLDDRTAAVFVRLCRNTTREGAPELLDAMAAGESRFVAIVAGPPLSIEQFGELWRHALSSRVSGGQAWKRLREWLDYAYRHPGGVQETFGRLLGEISADAVLRVLLDRHLEFWRLQDETRAARPAPAEPDDLADDDDFDDLDSEDFTEPGDDDRPDDLGGL